jgi:hypothetical protein
VILGLHWTPPKLINRNRRDPSLFRDGYRRFRADISNTPERENAVKINLTVEIADDELRRLLLALPYQAPVLTSEETEALAAEAAEMGRETTPAEEAVRVAETKKRKRRTKAEMVAEDNAIRGHVVEPEAGDLANRAITEMVGLFEQLVEEPPFEVPNETTCAAMEEARQIHRDSLLEQVRTRAKAVGGREWLVQHVLCGSKYPAVSAVPDAVLMTAMAV